MYQILYDRTNTYTMMVNKIIHTSSWYHFTRRIRFIIFIALNCGYSKPLNFWYTHNVFAARIYPHMVSILIWFLPFCGFQSVFPVLLFLCFKCIILTEKSRFKYICAYISKRNRKYTYRMAVPTATQRPHSLRCVSRIMIRIVIITLVVGWNYYFIPGLS